MKELNHSTVFIDKDAVKDLYKQKIEPVTQIEFNTLSLETQTLFIQAGISEKLVELVQNSGNNKTALLMQGFPALIKSLGIEFVKSKWDDLIDIGIAAGGTVYDLFKSGLPALEHSVKMDFVENHWGVITSVGKTTGTLSWAVYQHVIPSWRKNFGEEYVAVHLFELTVPGKITLENIAAIEEEGIPVTVSRFTGSTISKRSEESDSKQNQSIRTSNDKKEKNKDFKITLEDDFVSPNTQEVSSYHQTKTRQSFNIDQKTIEDTPSEAKLALGDFIKPIESESQPETYQIPENYSSQLDQVVSLSKALQKDLIDIQEALKDAFRAKKELDIEIRKLKEKIHLADETKIVDTIIKDETFRNEISSMKRYSQKVKKDKNITADNIRSYKTERPDVKNMLLNLQEKILRLEGGRKT